MKKSKVKVWAEIGINHQGNMGIAAKMIGMAAMAGCYGVKFQKRTPRLVLGDRYDNPRGGGKHDFGNTEGEHMEAREFDIEFHVELRSFAEERGLEYSCSTWDIDSTKQILQLNPKHIKIASPMNTSDAIICELLNANVSTYHISLGMTTREWRNTLFKYFSGRRVVWYACTSCYPCENDMTFIREISENMKVAASMGCVDDSKFEYGFSGHHRGIAIDNAALALGATWFERHFTLDRTWCGSDHAASLEYEGLRRLVRDLKDTESALRVKPDPGVVWCEEPSIKKLRR